MKSNSELQKDLNELLQPVFDYMQREMSPHCTLVVTPVNGMVYTGLCGLSADTILD